LLIYRPEDVALRRFFAHSGRVNASQVAQGMAAALQRPHKPIAPADLRHATALSETKLLQALSGLAEVGAMAFLPTGEVVSDQVVVSQQETDVHTVAAEAVRVQERRRHLELSRLAMMRGMRRGTTVAAAIC
jgi:hypothetical protein